MDSGNEYANLDFLRSAAVFLVLIDHLLETHGALLGTSFHPWDWYAGRAGVLMFFVHTSLVLMMSLERSKLSGLPMVSNFYVRRAFRVYPLSTLTIALVLFIQVPPTAWNQNLSYPGLGAIISNFLLTQNLTYSNSVLSPLWSLPYEMQMYVFLPFLFLIAKRFPSAWSGILLWFFCICCALIQPYVIGRLNVVQFSPCFAAGVIAFLTTVSSSRRVHSAFWWVVLIIVDLGLYAFLDNLDTQMHSPWVAWIFCLLLGGAVTQFRDLQATWLVKTCRVVARYSFGIYLFHMIALWVAFPLLEGNCSGGRNFFCRPLIFEGTWLPFSCMKS